MIIIYLVIFIFGISIGMFIGKNIFYKTKKLDLEKIKKLKEGKIYIHSIFPKNDYYLQLILIEAFGNCSGIYNKYNYYGKFGNIHAGFYNVDSKKTILKTKDFFINF